MKEDKLNAQRSGGTSDVTRTQFAQTMQWIASVGFVLLIAAFLVYILGLLPVRVELDEIARNWHKSSEELIESVDGTTGWQWVKTIGYGDTLSFATILLLAAATPICLLVLAAAYVREGNRIYAAIAAVQIVVLLFAASGLAVGGH